MLLPCLLILHLLLSVVSSSVIWDRGNSKAENAKNQEIVLDSFGVFKL